MTGKSKHKPHNWYPSVSDLERDEKTMTAKRKVLRGWAVVGPRGQIHDQFGRMPVYRTKLDAECHLGHHSFKCVVKRVTITVED